MKRLSFSLPLVVFLVVSGLCTSCGRESKGLREELKMLKQENSFLKAENTALKKETEELYRKIEEKAGGEMKAGVGQKPLVPGEDKMKKTENGKVKR